MTFEPLERFADRAADVERIVALALERLDEEEFPDLAALCGGDPQLLAEVERILSKDAFATSVLNSMHPLTPSPEFPIETLGDFHLVAPLGAGGMGRVFLAEQMSLGRLVAVKVLDSVLTRDERSRARFRREAEIAATLDHPNIVPVIAVGEDQGHHFIAMKWLSGPSLDQLTDALAPREVARIGVALARALHEAHLAGVLHRDVKPANVILDGDVPYLVDFGLARARGDVTLTRPDTAPGTVLYMAPESLRGTGPTLDPRTDVYSLGATLYELAAGRPPYAEETLERLLPRILLQDPIPLGLERRHADLETVILRALDRDPARRFATAADLADDLERFLEDLPVRSVRTGSLTRCVRLVRRHRRVSVIVGSLVLLVGVASTLLLTQWAEERARADRSRARITALLHDARPEEAAELLATLPRDAAATKSLAREIARIRLVEDALDTLMERSDAIDVEALDAILAELSALGPSADHPPLAARVELARTLAALAKGHREEVVARLPNLESYGAHPRCVAALRQGLGPDTRSELPSVGSDPDDGVFSSTVLGLSGASLSRQRAEIDATLERWPGHPRARLASAMLDAAELDDKENVPRHLSVFAKLQSPGRPRPILLRQLLRLHLLVEDAVAARAVSTQLGEARTPSMAASELALAALERRSEPERDARYAASLARFGRAPALLLARATDLSRRPYSPALAAEMRALLAPIESGDQPQRRLEASLVRLDLDLLDLEPPQSAGELRVPSPRSTPEHVAAAEALLARVRSMAPRVSSRTHRVRLARIEGRLLVLANRVEALLPWFSSLPSDLSGHRLDLAILEVVSGLSNRGALAEGRAAYLAGPLVAHAVSVSRQRMASLEASEGKSSAAVSDEMVRLTEISFALAWFTVTVETAEAWLERFEDDAPLTSTRHMEFHRAAAARALASVKETPAPGR